MKKSTKIVLFIIGAILLVSIVLVSIPIYRTYIKDGVVYHGVNKDLASFNYEKYKYGKYAEMFFADVDTSKGDSTEFFIFDGDTKSNVLHHFLTNYTVDITYKNNEIFSDEVNKMTEKYDYYKGDYKVGQFDIYIIKNHESFDVDTISFFAVNTEKQIIRFVIFFDTDTKQDQNASFYLNHYIVWNSPVLWYGNVTDA